MFVKPAPGMTVRFPPPGSQRILAAEGEDVPDTDTWWARRVAHGDVIDVAAAEAAAKASAEAEASAAAEAKAAEPDAPKPAAKPVIMAPPASAAPQAPAAPLIQA